MDRRKTRQPDCSILVIGFGNPGRCDDGLGPEFARRIESMRFPNVVVESNYQLNVEDAEQIAAHDVVIFADAMATGPEPFDLQPVKPIGTFRFTTHSVSPETLLALTMEIFKCEVQGFTLGIRGYRFDQFDESLSPRALANLEAAVQHLASMIQENRFPVDKQSNRNPTEPAFAGRWCDR